MKTQLSRSDAPALPRERLVQIGAEQIRALYQQAPLVILSNFIMPPLLIGALWNVSPQREAIVWLGAMVAVGVGRAILTFAYRRVAPDKARISRWGHYYLIGTLISGCLWGAVGPLLFVPGALDYQVILVLVLGGMCTGAVASLGADLRAFHAFALPTMLPYVAISLLQFDRVHLVVAVAMVFYLIAMSFFARNFNKTLIESWRLRFENLDLMTALTAKKEEAERANVAKSRFLAAASHDLRQPLHAMALFVSALRDKTHDETRPIVDKLTASIEALEGLFHALLDISKLDAGIVRPEVSDFHVQLLFDRIGREYAVEAAVKELRFACVPTRAVVRSDATLLERILRNLVSNAIRYTHVGGVVIGCRRRGGKIGIEVWDSGVGIEPTHHKEIFQEFYQVENPERDRSKGLGLGLAVVDRLARLLNHPLRFVSMPGRGSVFSVVVPHGEASATVPDVPAPAEFIGGKLGDALVVVIDDERAVLDGMREVLQEWGARPLLATSADDALEQLAHTTPRPAVVIADYRLRGEDTGVQAIQRIQSVYGTAIPGVLITGDTAPDRLREAEASGYQLLHKPVRPARLRALLSFLLNA